MATIRPGNRSALLVVDVQVGVVDGAWDTPRVVANVARTVERARAEGVPVFWVQHHDEDLPKDSPAWQWVPQLVPAEGEQRIHKQYNSAFEATPLAGALDALGTTHIVLAGAATNWCIRATAYGALERGYDLTLVADAHTTKPLQVEGGQAVPAANIVHDLNTAIQWLAYPGRRNSCDTVDQLQFAR